MSIHSQNTSFARMFAASVISFLILSSAMVALPEEKESAAVHPHSRMMRYPDVSAAQIVFVYADDLWLAAREGGPASHLASPPGEELFPRFSPDGRTIAFVGNYDGNQDIYTLPIAGGIPQRITHHPEREYLCDWNGNEQLIFSQTGLGGLDRQRQLFTVSISGGMPQKLSVPYGEDGAIDPGGEWLAYTPFGSDIASFFIHWKRYRGGLASDIWLFSLKNHSSKKVTDWEGTDASPMWQGKKIYYLSDAGASHRLNIWSYDTVTEQRKQITQFKDYDVHWPAVGPGANGEGEIVFQCGEDLYLLNLAREESRVVEITIPGARPTLRSKLVDVSKNIRGWTISSTGKRAAVEARGDIWTLPAKEGSSINLTRTSGAAERDPAWSPDGRWIAYFSDTTGEYELYIRPADGSGEPQKLTAFGKTFLFRPTWSPDSKWMVFQNSEDVIYLHNIEKKETKEIDKNVMLGGIPSFRFSWSSDSAWFAYTKRGENMLESIWLYNVKEGKTHQVTCGAFQDSEPTFDRNGEFLFFISNRDFSSPTYDDMGFSFVYNETGVLHAVPLRKDVIHPYKTVSDEETWEEKKSEPVKSATPESAEIKSATAAGEVQKSGMVSGATVTGATPAESQKAEAKIKSVTIDLDGFEARAFRLPIPKGSLSALCVNDKGQLIYQRRESSSSESVTSLKLFDLKDTEKKEKTVLNKVNWVTMSADGKKLLVNSENDIAVIDAAPDQKIENKISTAAMKTIIAPREEWRQIFVDAWRIMRDFFFDPHMHGVDWPAVRKQYEPMLDDCVTREDVGFVIGEMLGELNASHVFTFGGDIERGPNVSVGFLGIDFVADQGFYKISKIYEGGVGDTDARNPISTLDKKSREEFQYLFAVNGIPVDASKDLWAAFQGLANQVVTLSVGKNPSIQSATEVTMKLISASDESKLRFRAWIEANRALVEKKTDGKVGYIYVTDTSTDGQGDLFRQFYGQMHKPALIIDERWNSGGQMPDRFVQLLNRPVSLHLFKRHEKNWRVPEVSHQGPKCMLINGPSGSGGDLFPYLFRQAKVGKLIGMRTWGGVIGIFGNPGLIDGAFMTAPNITMYENDGTLTMEGHGVDPDMEVVDDPAKMVDGSDPQLDAAIQYMLEEIKNHPYTPPARPAYPDRSGMGIREDYK